MSDRALTVINVVALAVIVMFPLWNINDDKYSFKVSFIQYGNPTALQYRSDRVPSRYWSKREEAFKVVGYVYYWFNILKLHSTTVKPSVC